MKTKNFKRPLYCIIFCEHNEYNVYMYLKNIQNVSTFVYNELSRSIEVSLSYNLIYNSEMLEIFIKYRNSFDHIYQNVYLSSLCK